MTEVSKSQDPQRHKPHLLNAMEPLTSRTRPGDRTHQVGYQRWRYITPKLSSRGEAARAKGVGLLNLTLKTPVW